jgi:hypothetical protein
MRSSAWTIASLVLLVTACGGSRNPPVQGGTEIVSGSERFGWTQPAADAGEIATFRYAFYVDDVRSEAEDATCAPGDTGGRFACSSSLPPMAAGSHTLQIAAFLLDGGVVRESSRSAAVRVVRQ